MIFFSQMVISTRGLDSGGEKSWVDRRLSNFITYHKWSWGKVFNREQEVVPKRRAKEFFLAVMSQWKNPTGILLQKLLAKWRFIFVSRKEHFSLMPVV